MFCDCKLDLGSSQVIVALDGITTTDIGLRGQE